MKRQTIIWIALLAVLPLQARIDYENLPASVRLHLGPAPVEDTRNVEVRVNERTAYTGEVRAYRIANVPTRFELELRPTLTELHRRQSQAYWNSWRLTPLDTAPPAWARSQSFSK